MSAAPTESDVPQGVSVRWGDVLGAEAYRAPAPRRPVSITLAPARRGLVPVGAAGLGGATGAALLFEYGITHARSLATLAGVSLAVISGVLLDRLAPRLFNRTELRFAADALEVRMKPLGDPRPTRIPYREVTAFEVEVVVDPMAAPPVVVHQVQARRVDGTLEVVFGAVDDAETAAWLRRTLTLHAVRA